MPKRGIIDWTNIGHPLAQLMRCMFDARSRYGVLSSGSRSYFFKVEFAELDPRVFITDAWFVGGKDYLRAWSYLYHLAIRNAYLTLREGWPRWLRDSSVDDSGTARFVTWLDPSIGPSIPRVDGFDIEYLQLLGGGNHDAYLALWNGDEVAVKWFDAYKHLEMFKDEVSAYEHLKDAWGVLVPEPYFIADYYSNVVLGMQLGRQPNRSDSEIGREIDNLHRTLRRGYGFEHLSLSVKNSNYLPDKTRTGKDRLAAIDLEFHKILR